MRVYEELFIMKPGTPEEEIDAYVGQIKDLIMSGKGTVEKADKWGTRKLAYRVQKYSEGILHPDPVHRSGRAGQGSGAPHAQHRHGDQVHHGAHR